MHEKRVLGLYDNQGWQNHAKQKKRRDKKKMHVKQDYPYYAKEESNKKRSTKDKKQTKGGTIREKIYYI